MNTRKMVAAFGIAMILGGCLPIEEEAKSYSSMDISGGTPSGVINGSDWTMAVAEVRREGADLSVQLFAESIETCGFASSEKPKVMFRVPASTGEYPMSFSQSVTFVEPPAHNTIAVDGVIDIQALSETSVILGLIAEAGDGFSVNGTLATVICP